MEKANRVIWNVKMKDELDLAALATDPKIEAFHRERAIKFKRFADQSFPDASDDLDFS